MPMAEVTTFLHLHDSDDEPRHLHNNFTLHDSLPFWAHHHDLDFYSSDLDFPPSDRPRIVAVHEAEDEDYDNDNDNDNDDLFFQYQSATNGNVSAPNSSAPNPDLSEERENQVNFVMDLFQQRVEQSSSQSRALVRPILVSEDSTFGVIEGSCDDVGMDDLDLGLGLGSGLDFRHCLDCDDDFFVGRRRVSGSESGEAARSNLSRIMGFVTDSDEEDENGVIGIGLNRLEEEEYDDGDDHLRDAANVDEGIPLCWDSLLLDEEHHREENNEDFEWEEVEGGGVEEREVFSMFIGPDHEEESLSVSVSGIAIGAQREEEVSVERFEPLESVEWEVLLDANTLEMSADAGGDLDDYIYPGGMDDLLFGQFSENENAATGRPPAAHSVVENLPSVVLTQEDVEKGNAPCAVCKDDMNVGEEAKQLPCAHRYHGDCIVPWLHIRNTCPVCRHELPTDDAGYERRRTQRPARGHYAPAPDYVGQVFF